MDFNPGIHILADSDPEMAIAELSKNRWLTFVLDGAEIVNRQSFFAAVRSVLPLNPPVQSDWCWDALSDSLWQGIHELDADRVAIVWKDHVAMSGHAQGDYEVAVQILASLLVTLSDMRLTHEEPTELCVVLV